MNILSYQYGNLKGEEKIIKDFFFRTMEILILTEISTAKETILRPSSLCKGNTVTDDLRFPLKLAVHEIHTHPPAKC